MLLGRLRHFHKKRKKKIAGHNGQGRIIAKRKECSYVEKQQYLP